MSTLGAMAATAFARAFPGMDSDLAILLGLWPSALQVKLALNCCGESLVEADRDEPSSAGLVVSSPKTG